MTIRQAATADLASLAALAEPLQRRSASHVAYLSLDAGSIAAELQDIAEGDGWTAVSAVASGDRSSEVGGWLIGSVDQELDRVAWHGPFIADGPADSQVGGEVERWNDLADALYEQAAGLLPSASDEEFAVDDEHVRLIAWAQSHGFTAGTASVILVRPLSELDLAPDQPEGLVVRPATPADRLVVAPLHDELFPDTHTPGRRLIPDDPDPHQPRLVAEADGEPIGYVAFERGHDGEAYIDFLGVAPSARRQGIGGILIQAALSAGHRLGCHQAGLTVHETNEAARSLYRNLGFEEERLLRPLRKSRTD